MGSRTGCNTVTCNICSKKIQKRQKSAKCSICKLHSHLKCNKFENSTYNKSDHFSEIFMCIQCNQDSLPFYHNITKKHESYNRDLLPSDDIKLFFTEMNNFSIAQSDPLNDDDMDISPLINCKYVDINTLSQQKVNNKTFSIIHLNIASLEKNKDEFEATLSLLKFKFDVIGISETKIKKGSDPKYDLKISGYKHFHTPSEANKGGVIIYVLEKYDTKPCKNLDKIMYKSHLLESCFIEIVVPNKKNIIIGCIYRHPSMNLSDFNDDHLSPLLEQFSDKKHTFLLGDFNVDLMNTDQDSKTTDYFDLLTSAHFVPHIIQPTRITSHCKTLIDNIFSNMSNFSQGTSGNLTIALSDHLAQFLLIELDTIIKPPKTARYKRDIKNFDRENFLLDLLDIDWLERIDLRREDPNFSFQQFYNAINSLIDKYMPLRQMTKKEIKLQSKPWLTKQILDAIRERDSVYKRFVKAKDSDLKTELCNQYKTLRNKVNDDIRDSKNIYFQNFFVKNANNIKNTWKGIKSIICLKSSRKSQPNSIMVNNALISDPNKVADTFNEHFSSIATHLQNRIHHHGKAFTAYLKDPNENSFFIIPTNPLEVINQINGLNSNKAEGPSSIPTEILQLITPTIANPLTEIINLSFNTGIYIENLKMAKVVPIFKDKGSDLDFTNYRPISLLSNINKIIEKIIHERLYSFLEKYQCIYELQYGFRSGHSIDHCLIDLTENIRSAIDANKYAVGVFVDLQKAFDTVDHSILLRKLDHYGIRGTANKWFHSYLSNRTQYVTINGVDSKIMQMKHGVPQGSVLGPLLFLLYINDLRQCITHSITRHFADDTSLLIVNSSLKKLKNQLNYDLKCLSMWLTANKISLNVSKTETLIFRHPNKPLNYDLKIKLDGKRLHPSKFVKYLGLLMDPNLNWSHHTKALASKLTRATGMLAKVRHFVNKATLHNIYHGIFSSLMSFGSQIWGQNINSHVKRIVKLQDKAIRIINFADFRAPPSALYKNSQILRFSDSISLKNFLYAHNSINRRIPSTLQGKFKFIEERHEHTTRINQLHCVQLPISRTTDYGLLSITSKTARIWNRLQIIYFKGTAMNLTRNVCKKRVKTYFLNQY